MERLEQPCQQPIQPIQPINLFPTRPTSMAQIKPVLPVDVRPLFDPLHRELLMMLRTLAPEDWQRQTSAPQWKVLNE